MNTKIQSLFLLASTLGVVQGAFAQREAPNRGERRQQRQQEMANLTPEQRSQAVRSRWEERYKAASPEQKLRMDDMRKQMENRMREQGLDPNNPQDAQKAIEAAIGGAGGNGQGGRGQAERGQGGRGQGGRERNRGANVVQTPEMRDEARRALMASSGISDRATQNAIIAFMNDEEKARGPVLQLARTAAASLDPNPKKQYSKNANGELVEVVLTPAPGSEEAVANNLQAYSSALEADKTRHQTALAALDTRISYSTKPRVKAFLSLVGILDSHALSLGGAATIFPPVATPNGGAQNGGAPNDAPRQRRRGNRGTANAAE